MKLLIVSDTHGRLEYMFDAVVREKPDMVFHLGDNDQDADYLGRRFPRVCVVSMKGNCDYFSPYGREEYLYTLEGVRIFAVHGHQYGVKSGLMRFSYAAAEKEARLALFGHTHRPCCQTVGDLTMFNPGACGGYRPTYGVVTVKDGTLQCEIKNALEEET